MDNGDNKIFNGWYASLIKRGLELVAIEMKAEVDKVKASGKNCLYTKGFVDMTMKEINGLVDDTTKPDTSKTIELDYSK